MVHGSGLTFILKNTHDCIWHASPIAKFKEELAHHIEYCEIFSHHIMFICAFTAWVRDPSILYTFILKRCHAFIIRVIVVTWRSIFFIEQFLWHLITVNHSRTNFHLCPTGSQHVMSKWAHFHIWAMRMTRLSYRFVTAGHGGREAGSNIFTCCDILGPFFSILDKKCLETGIIHCCLRAAIQHAYGLFQLLTDRTLEQIRLA